MHQLWNSIAQKYRDRFLMMTEIFKRLLNRVCNFQFPCRFAFLITTFRLSNRTPKNNVNFDAISTRPMVATQWLQGSKVTLSRGIAYSFVSNYSIHSIVTAGILAPMQMWPLPGHPKLLQLETPLIWVPIRYVNRTFCVFCVRGTLWPSTNDWWTEQSLLRVSESDIILSCLMTIMLARQG